MSKLKDYIKEHKKSLREKARLGCLALIVVSALALYGELKTNVKQHGKTVIVSNYDVGKGYVFIYNAEESGWEYLVEDRGEYVIFAETDKDDKFKPKIYIRFEDLGKNHPLNGRYIYPEDETKVEIGEELLSRTREKYKDHIPFQKILDKIKD